MDNPTAKVVIVGGGTAGWLTACRLAAQYPRDLPGGLDLVLIESPDVPRIGVGEGTWPSMRMTLKAAGVTEAELVARCDASFKQGTEFIGWADDSGTDFYYHPFSLPAEYSRLNLADWWPDAAGGRSFAEFVTPQAAVIRAGLAPKQPAMPEFAFAVNYGYHFDAGRFADLLHEQAVSVMAVGYRAANVIAVESADNGDIAALLLDTGERVSGDLFIDCSGQRALLIGEHYGVDFVSVKEWLLNDAAIAVQVPHAKPTAALPSVTRATAADAGWIWDIALPSRRGLGYVHSTAHTDHDVALSTIRDYIRLTSPDQRTEDLTFRCIRFEPGHRREFWVRNCAAVGLSGGFIEPLEASAIALIEQAAGILCRQFPANRALMPVVARRFNETMHYHWKRVVEFLKLHYVLSRRDGSAYWRDARSEGTCPADLRDKLLLWRQQAPWHEDAPRLDELFPSASYQYVLYGMGFQPSLRERTYGRDEADRAEVNRLLRENELKARQLLTRLPANRELLDALTALAGVA